MSNKYVEKFKIVAPHGDETNQMSLDYISYGLGLITVVVIMVLLFKAYLSLSKFDYKSALQKIIGLVTIAAAIQYIKTIY